MDTVPEALQFRIEDLAKRIAVAKVNPCHVKSGPQGGQFCETKGGGGGSVPYSSLPVGTPAQIRAAGVKYRPTGDGYTFGDTFRAEEHGIRLNRPSAKIRRQRESAILNAPFKPKPKDTRPDLTGKNKVLMDVAITTGTKLYGRDSSGLIIDRKTVERGSVRSYTSGSDAGRAYDTFDYVFFPSKPGKGLDVADRPINFRRHADVDGKIYVGGSNGVFVISPSKK